MIRRIKIALRALDLLVMGRDKRDFMHRECVKLMRATARSAERAARLGNFPHEVACLAASDQYARRAAYYNEFVSGREYYR